MYLPHTYLCFLVTRRQWDRDDFVADCVLTTALCEVKFVRQRLPIREWTSWRAPTRVTNPHPDGVTENKPLFGAPKGIKSSR